jgi:hypothetical protein
MGLAKWPCTPDDRLVYIEQVGTRGCVGLVKRCSGHVKFFLFSACRRQMSATNLMDHLNR